LKDTVYKIWIPNYPVVIFSENAVGVCILPIPS